jgi:hypothetical protein
MPKVFPCYSTPERELVRELAAFLERGAGVEVLLEEGEMAPGGDLVAKVEEGLSADVVLVLISPERAGSWSAGSLSFGTRQPRWAPRWQLYCVAMRSSPICCAAKIFSICARIV